MTSVVCALYSQMSLLHDKHHDSDALTQQQQQQQQQKLMRRCNAGNAVTVDREKSACPNDRISAVKEQTRTVSALERTDDDIMDTGETFYASMQFKYI